MAMTATLTSTKLLLLGPMSGHFSACLAALRFESSCHAPPPSSPLNFDTPLSDRRPRASPAHCWAAQGYYFDGLLGTCGQAGSSLYYVFK
jgi:hypothetical protein